MLTGRLANLAGMSLDRPGRLGFPSLLLDLRSYDEREGLQSSMQPPCLLVVDGDQSAHRGSTTASKILTIGPSLDRFRGQCVAFDDFRKAVLFIGVRVLKISIVTTIYKSAGDINEFYTRSVAVASELSAELELIFVNDGSPDDGLAVARRLASQASEVTVIDLSRNFGQARALWTGVKHSTGDLVAILDGDLEEDPAWLVSFYRAMEESQADVAYGIQADPKGSAVYRSSRKIFYRVLNALTAFNFPTNVATIRLMSRRFVRALMQYEEHEFFLLGLLHVAGFAQIGVRVEKVQRSPTTYTFGKLAQLFMNGVTSFSTVPLTFIAVCGILLSFGASLFVFYLVFIKGPTVEGWLSVMAAIIFFSGVIVFFLGIIAIYVGTIFLEVKRRPVTIVREIIRPPGSGTS